MAKRFTREQRALLRLDLSAFIEMCFYELKPGEIYRPHWSVDLVAAKLEACRHGKIKRLIINKPPRSLKSIEVSVAFAAFILGHDPFAEIICVSYAQDLAEKFSRDTRQIMQSDWYQQIFPETRISNSKNSNAEFVTTKNGFRLATSVGGTLTGRGGRYIFIDDPIKPGDALSKAVREATNSWTSHTLFSRLNNKNEGVIIVAMQRVGQGDLTDYLLELGGWEHVSLPAIAQEDEEHVFDTPYGRTRVTRKKGEALHPEHESLGTLEEIRRTLGSATFAAQYLQAPRPAEGNLVDPAWLKTFKPEDLPEKFDQIVMSVDSANKATELADYTAVAILRVKAVENKASGARETKIYLTHMLRRKMNYPELKRTVKEMAAQFGATVVLIEDKASGTQLIQDLVSEGLHSVKGIEPSGDKVMRMNAQTATIENGFFYIPEEAHWREAFIDELATFPNAKHDDQVDAMAQALEWIKTNKEPGMLGWARMELAKQQAAEGTHEADQALNRRLAASGMSHVDVLMWRARNGRS